MLTMADFIQAATFESEPEHQMQLNQKRKVKKFIDGKIDRKRGREKKKSERERETVKSE